MRRIIEIEKIKDGWDAPISIKFLIGFAILGLFSFEIILLLISLFVELIFFGKDYQLWMFGLSLLLALTVFVLLEIPLYKSLHRLNYLHYCKSVLVGQIMVLIYFLLTLFWALVNWKLIEF